jgi:chromosome segregation ATPase
LLSQSNEQLAQKSTEAADLQVLCSKLRDEAAATRRKAAPLAEKVRLLEEDLKRVSGEQEEFRRQTVEASSRAGSLARELKAQQSEV